MKKLLRGISSFLLRAHKGLDRRLANSSSTKPRSLNYKCDKSLPKIVHFNGNFVVGGTSQYIADIIENTSDKYYHRVIVPRLPHPLPYQPLPAKAYSLADMTGLYESLEKEKPSLVHIHYWVRPMHRFFDFGIWYTTVFRICEELGLKVIQNIDVPTKPFCSPSVLHNVFVSNYVRDNFNDSNLPSSVIYPGSNMKHFNGVDEQPLPETIGMVYRLDRDKLDEKVIEVFILAVKKKPGLQCFMIGGGYYLDHFKKRVAEEGLENNFIFTGFVSYEDLPSFYKKIGLIVAPVNDESFGQVTPFAMGMGLPVVGYDTGAMSEILGSKKYLVPCGDAEALSVMIAEMMNDQVQRKQAGLANKKRAQQLFGLESMITSYSNLYQSLV